jgi:hypothetical protein
MSLRLLSLTCLVIAAQCEGASPLERRTDRYVKLPVVHSTNRQVFAGVYDGKRAIATVPLAKRSDVAYYAKCVFVRPNPVD